MTAQAATLSTTAGQQLGVHIVSLAVWWNGRTAARRALNEAKAGQLIEQAKALPPGRPQTEKAAA